MEQTSLVQADNSQGVGKSTYPLSANANVLSATSRLAWELH